jgi:CBS domain-containing protein
LKTKIVKDLMVPLSEYATVDVGATLQDAVLALRKAQEEKRGKKYLHRAVVVLDEDGKTVLGKVSMVDILRSLEPKYGEMLSEKKSLHLGFTAAFQRTMIEQLRLWEEPMEHLCQKSVDLKVNSFLTTPLEGEIIDAGSTLDEAIHLLVLGYHQSLLVMEDKAIIGILRLADVFEVVTDKILACEM